MSEKLTPGPLSGSERLTEAVSVHTRKIYDSCQDKDCVEDLRFYPDRESQQAVNTAIGLRARNVELLNVQVDVEPVAFNRGYYTVDARYYYKIRGEAYTLGNRSREVCGLAIFDKRVLLFGSEGNVKTYSSDETNTSAAAEREREGLPVAVVQTVDPIILDFRLSDAAPPLPGEPEQAELPGFVNAAFPGGIELALDGRGVYVTLGQFSIIRLERDTQLLLPIYDYSMPTKECVGGGGEDDPCELFRRIGFPVDEFFPPDSLGAVEDYRGVKRRNEE